MVIIWTYLMSGSIIFNDLYNKSRMLFTVALTSNDLYATCFILLDSLLEPQLNITVALPSNYLWQNFLNLTSLERWEMV